MISTSPHKPQDVQAEVDLIPSWKDLAAVASRAVDRVNSNDTVRYLDAAKHPNESGERPLRLPPKLKVVARH